MRRVAALLMAVALVMALGGSSLAGTQTPKPSFVGSFAEVDPADGSINGHITAQLQLATSQGPVPGSFDFNGAPGHWIRESHAQIGRTQFWFDPNAEGGARVAMGEGVECVYFRDGSTGCHTWAVMFIDYVDPTRHDEVAFAVGGDYPGSVWDFQYLSWVGKGAFVMRGTFPSL
jgi:hypothetical protein